MTILKSVLFQFSALAAVFVICPKNLMNKLSYERRPLFKDLLFVLMMTFRVVIDTIYAFIFQALNLDKRNMLPLHYFAVMTFVEG